MVAQEKLAVVVCCGQPIGAHLATDRLIDAIEDVGSRFSSYSVHLVAGHLHAHDARDNTHLVLRAWTIRNHRVVLHLLASDTANSTHLPSERPLLAEAPARALPAFVRSTIPSHVGYVLVIDGQLPHSFYPEALLGAFRPPAPLPCPPHAHLPPQTVPVTRDPLTRTSLP